MKKLKKRYFGKLFKFFKQNRKKSNGINKILKF